MLKSDIVMTVPGNFVFRDKPNWILFMGGNWGYLLLTYDCNSTVILSRDS